MENEIENSGNTSPNYEQQLEEIEILKNILPEKVTILKESPNFIIQIEIEGDNPNQEEPNKTFYLEVSLNNDYPEKMPKIKISEENNNLTEEKKEAIIKKLDEYCQENLGMPVIYQLYEIMKEFADEEEKISLVIEKEKKNGLNSNSNLYQLNSLQKLKQIKLKDIYPIDIHSMKDGNIIIIYNNGIIKIYDSEFDNILFEFLQSDSKLPILFTKYFDFFPNNSRLYLFTRELVLIYEISVLNKKNCNENENYKINGNIKVDFIYELYANDVIELPQYEDSYFLIREDDKENLLYKNSKKGLNSEGIAENKFEQPFRKLHYINADKFMLASYTLINNKGKITGINKMLIVNSNNFEINKSYDIKISPLNNIEIYKNKYLIFSFFTTIEKDEENEKDPYYNFEDNFYNEIFHKIIKKLDGYYYDDYGDEFYREEYNEHAYDEYENKYYSYDLKKHYIGIYSIEYEEFLTKIDFDFVKRMYNINDNLLFLFVRKGKNNKRTQISYERIFHDYYNDIPLEEISTAENYKTEKYLAFALLDYGMNVLSGNVDYDNITSFIETNQHCLVICSERKGIMVYK